MTNQWHRPRVSKSQRTNFYGLLFLFFHLTLVVVVHLNDIIAANPLSTHSYIVINVQRRVDRTIHVPTMILIDVWFKKGDFSFLSPF